MLPCLHLTLWSSAGADAAPDLQVRWDGGGGVRAAGRAQLRQAAEVEYATTAVSDWVWLFWSDCADGAGAIWGDGSRVRFGRVRV